VVGNQAVVKLHVWASQRPVFGRSAFHALAPHPERTGLKLVAHEANHIRFRPPHPFLNGFKRSPVFPSHLNDDGNIPVREDGKTL
jgi:hypothetical protein